GRVGKAQRFTAPGVDAVALRRRAAEQQMLAIDAIALEAARRRTKSIGRDAQRRGGADVERDAIGGDAVRADVARRSVADGGEPWHRVQRRPACRPLRPESAPTLRAIDHAKEVWRLDAG